MNFRGIDYKSNIFETPEVTKIIGEPGTSDILTLRRQIRGNAISVHTTLGGGKYGYLGLTCHDDEYSEIVDTEPYKRPENPRELKVTEGAIQYQIVQQKFEHEEATKLFREVLGVERALIQQITGAIDPKYIQALRNPVTHKINKLVSGERGNESLFRDQLQWNNEKL